MKLSLPVLSCALLCAGVLHATTIYSNFGAAPGYQPGSGLSIGLGVAESFTVGSPITAGDEFALSSIEVALVDTANDGGDPVTVALYSDVGGLPGALLTSQLVVINQTAAAETFTFADTPVLSDNTQYWVALSDNNNGLWNANNNSVDAKDATYDGTVWTLSSGPYALGALTVTADEIVPSPEPASFAMLGCGCVALFVIFARRRAATAREV